MVLILALIEIPAELLLAEVLIPWSWLRALLLIVSLYGFFWMAGFFASLRVLRHRLEPRGLRIHYGAFADGFVPYQLIQRISLERRASPLGRDGLRVSPETSSAYLAAGGRTDLTIELREPHSLNGLMNPTIPVRAIHLATDEPERLGRELQRRADVALSGMAGGAAEDISAQGDSQSRVLVAYGLV